MNDFSKFKQAIKWLKEGKKVRRSIWNDEQYIFLCDDSFEGRKILLQNNKEVHLKFKQFDADDWEIYEEKEKTLSDKIYEKSFGFDGKLHVEDVKESIGNIKREINNPSGQVDCSVDCIFRIINKEMGPKLT